jgi:hypothetical protein
MVMPDKSRYVYLYLPSAEDKARWEKLAEEAGVPLSKFVIEVFESTLAEESDFKSRGELVKEIGKLRSENKLLRDDVNQPLPDLVAQRRQLLARKALDVLDSLDAFEQSHGRDFLGLG